LMFALQELGAHLREAIIQRRAAPRDRIAC
jgi:hypothetical protein